MNKDYKKYFCLTTKRHIWVLGYLGGGAINFERLRKEVEKFWKETGISPKHIYIDEIFKSSRFQGFKFLFSDVENQRPLPYSDCMDDVMKWLTD